MSWKPIANTHTCKVSDVSKVVKVWRIDADIKGMKAMSTEEKEAYQAGVADAAREVAPVWNAATKALATVHFCLVYTDEWEKCKTCDGCKIEDELKAATEALAGAHTDIAPVTPSTSRGISLPTDIASRFRSGSGTADCRPGWLPTILAIHNAVLAVNPDYKIFNIKEKYGTLDYQLSTLDVDRDLAWAMERAVGSVNNSSQICEVCGADGRMIDDGCMRVRCKTCQSL